MQISKGIGAATLIVAGLSTLAPAHAGPARCGRASWYALTSTTASGERMNPAAMTAAHRTLPFGTRLHLVNQENGREVVVRINDRGPFVAGRVLDLSKAAADRLGFVRSGHAPVCMRRIG